MVEQTTEVEKPDLEDAADDADDAAAEEAAEEEAAAEDAGTEEAEDAEGTEEASTEASEADTKPSEEKPRARVNAVAAAAAASRKDRMVGLDPVRMTAIVVTLIAAIAAAWSGWSWYGAEHDDSLAYSAARDEALQNGEQAIQNLNTLDYRALDKSLQSWVDSSTGDLQRDITQGRAGFEQKMREAQTVSTAKVLEGAVTELDDRSGKARVIVAVEVTVTPPKGDPVVKRNRLIGELTRTRAGWKLSAVAPAPVGNA